jgi:hypothetical protein
MMQKRTLTSLLLTSFLVAFAFSYSMANEVTFGSPTVLRCDNNVLNVTVDNTVDVAAIEIVFEISGTGGAYFDAFNVNWDAGFTELGTRIIDLSQADGVDPDTVRLAALLIDAADAVLPIGNHVVAQVSFSTNASCAGTVGLDGSIFNYPSVPSTIQTQFVDASTFDVLPAAVNAGTVTIQNAAPALAAIPDATLPWGTLYTGTAVGTDGDMANGCEVLTYSKVSGPAGLAINASSGAMTWATSGADVCEHVVTIQVEDSCGASAQQSFTICVTNVAPVASSLDQDEPQWVLGDLVEGGVTASDVDNGPNNLEYTVISFGGPGAVTMDPNTGDWSWQTVAFDQSYRGAFEICVEVTDNANVCDPCSPANADTVCGTIVVKQALLVIDKNHGLDTDNDGIGNGVLQGQPTSLDIYFDANVDIGGFDLLVHYDPTALTFNGAHPGSAIADCGWEYFQYRTTPFGNCTAGCPEGYLRIVAIADQNDGPNHPDCVVTSGTADSVLVTLDFLVTSDYTFHCQFVPVTFYWFDCGDNTMSSTGGDTLFISNSVWSYAGGVGTIGTFPDTYNELPQGTAFPSGGGHIDACETSDKGEPWRVIDFWNGGIDIICTGDIDGRGDLNLDGLGYTIADAVIFTNYFIFGLNAFANLPGANATAAAIAASDANNDGLTLTVADLVYLIRVVVGDAVPYPDSPIGKLDAVSANLATINGNLAIPDVEIAAAYVELKGDVAVTLLASNMAMESNFDGTVTKVLVFPPFEAGENTLNTFSGEFLNVGNASIVATEIVTPAGALVEVDVLPSNFALEQNYPNPFNPSTTIEFALPVASNYTLTIYNVTGQRVAEFAGAQQAGLVKVVWEAGQNASGVYFYKLATDSFTETKKMVLLK